MKGRATGVVALLVALSLFLFLGTALADKKGSGRHAASGDESAVKESKCFECHDAIKELKASGKHAKVNCVSCHTGTAALQRRSPYDRFLDECR